MQQGGDAQNLGDLVQDLTGQVRVLSAEVEKLKGQVERLQKRLVEAARPSSSSAAASPGAPEDPASASEGESAWSRVTASPAPATPASGYSGTSGGNQSIPNWTQREAIADQIGEFIARALNGDHRSSSGRDLIPLSSRLWIVVRDYDQRFYNPVKVFKSWGPVKELVKRGSSAGDSVFVGLPSEREARRVVQAARLLWPARIEG